MRTGQIFVVSDLHLGMKSGTIKMTFRLFAKRSSGYKHKYWFFQRVMEFKKLTINWVV